MQPTGTPMYGFLTLRDLARAIAPAAFRESVRTPEQVDAEYAAERVGKVLMNRFGITHADIDLALEQILPKLPSKSD